MTSRYAFHPLLIATFPVLFLWAENRTEVLFGHVVGPLLVTVGATIGVFAVSSLVLRDHRRGALVASSLAFITLSYGHVWNLLPSETLGPWLMVVGWFLISVLGVLVAARIDHKLSDATNALNVVAAVLVLVAGAPLLPRIMTAGGDSHSIEPGADTAPSGLRDATTADRDIFYIVPDRYPRGDNLKELFGIDNSDFLGYLEDRGFEVADESISNYNKTAHSLAASLNMNYLAEIAAHVRDSDIKGDSFRPLYDRIHDHAVGRFLDDVGYRHIQLGMWWEASATAATADVTFRYGGTSEFRRVFEQTTPVPAIRRIFGLGSDVGGLRSVSYATTLHQLSKLEEVAERRSEHPRFVFVHLALPHKPYVFKADGSWLGRREENRQTLAESFGGQLEYTNLRLRRIVDRLLEGPEDEHPIIVIQADEALHPARFRADERFVWPNATDGELLQKFRILSAYYLPGLEGRNIHEGITPVNTFRFIFDHYFGTDYGLLPDRAFVNYDQHRLYEFTDVTVRIRNADSLPPDFEP